MRFIAIVAVCVTAIASTCIAGEPIASAIITGKAQAKDGDSILIGEGKGTIDVRLHGIDAPEWDQECKDKEDRPWPCGVDARTELGKLVDGKQLRCEVTDIEKSAGKRPIVRCFHGLINISETMLSNGMAWVFDRYAKGFEDYSALKAIEAEAKSTRRGVWKAGVELEPPWQFRERRWERYAALTPNGCPIIGYPKSLIYHTPWSRGYQRMFGAAIRDAKKRRWFCSDREAVAAGFRLAR